MDINLVAEAIVESVNELEGVYKKDPVIRKFFADEAEIEKLLAVTEEIILNALQGKESLESSALEIASHHIEMEFPYIPLINCMDKLKNETLYRLSGTDIDTQEQVRQLFEAVKNNISFGYIIRDLTAFDLSTADSLYKDRMYLGLLQWFYDFREAVLAKEYERAMLMASEPCPFERFFNSLAYRMRCISFALCESLEKAHDEFHEIAKNFSFLMSEGDYTTAYFLLSEFKSKVGEFIRNLEKLHVIFADDAENIFFKMVSDMAKTKGEKTLLIVGFKNLLMLSSIYSKQVIDLIFEKLSQLFEEIMDQRDNTVAVKGAGRDFFVLSMEPPKEFVPVLKAKLDEFSEILGDELEDTKPEFIIAGLRLEPYVSISEDEARKSLYHLKLEAIKRGLDQHILDKEERVSLIADINKKYKDIRLISEVLNEGKVDIYFQPIFDCESTDCKFYCLEALARIVVDKKYISAGVFIDLIYEMDLIEKLDSLVADKLIHYAKHLAKVAERVSINASPRSLKSYTFQDKLVMACTTLQEVGITPIIELTEQSLLENTDLVDKLNSVCCVKFGVDDFGVGYSSLKMVADLAEKGVLEMLKIDGSLIKGLVGSEKIEKIVRIIVNISRELGVACVAEFVEDEETMERLQELGVNLFQGYLLGVPEHLTSILAKHIKSKKSVSV